jgi:hypothetical protein
MTTADSTSTLPLTTTTGKPAPKPNGKDLLIKIDVHTATFHCQDVEHAGPQNPRHVTFQPDAPCVLLFTNSEVFGKAEAPLIKGDNELPVLSKDGTETSYRLDGAETVKSPPKIVVP